MPGAGRRRRGGNVRVAGGLRATRSRAAQTRGCWGGAKGRERASATTRNCNSFAGLTQSAGEPTPARIERTGWLGARFWPPHPDTLFRPGRFATLCPPSWGILFLVGPAWLVEDFSAASLDRTMGRFSTRLDFARIDVALAARSLAVNLDS